MGLIKALFFALFPTLIVGQVYTIHACDLDNCLRQVRSNSLQASPFCSTYIPKSPYPKVYPTTVTSYTFVRPTVFSVAGGKPSLVHRVDVPYTPLNWEPDKRDLQARVPDPTPAPEAPVEQLELEPRQAGGFASKCGSGYRLSSACTCLIGDILPTPTETIAKPTGPAITIGVCGSDLTDFYNTQYGLRVQGYGGYEFRHNHGQIQSTRFSAIKNLAGCCDKCFHTTGCTAYHLDSQTSECEIDTLVSSTKPTPEDPRCPAGLQYFYEPYQNSFNNNFALGLCAYAVPSDE